jgi:hypothetical protein
MPLASVDDRQSVDVLRANLRVRFVNDRNYEPPQGRIFIEDDFNGLVRTNDFGYSGIWTLSEDKNDRRDGLWGRVGKKYCYSSMMIASKISL